MEHRVLATTNGGGEKPDHLHSHRLLWPSSTLPRASHAADALLVLQQILASLAGPCYQRRRRVGGSLLASLACPLPESAKESLEVEQETPSVSAHNGLMRTCGVY